MAFFTKSHVHVIMHPWSIWLIAAVQTGGSSEAAGRGGESEGGEAGRRASRRCRRQGSPASNYRRSGPHSHVQEVPEAGGNALIRQKSFPHGRQVAPNYSFHCTASMPEFDEFWARKHHRPQAVLHVHRCQKFLNFWPAFWLCRFFFYVSIIPVHIVLRENFMSIEVNTQFAARCEKECNFFFVSGFGSWII